MVFRTHDILKKVLCAFLCLVLCAFSGRACASYVQGEVVIRWSQSGAGSASPDNVRPITGVYCGEEAGIVYGGVLDIESGVLTVTHGVLNLDAGFSWIRHGTYTNCYAATPWTGAVPTQKPPIFSTGAASGDAVCSVFNVTDDYDSPSALNSSAPDFSIAVAPYYWSRSQPILVVKISQGLEKQWLDGAQLVFPLQETYTVTLTGDEVSYVLYQLGYVAGDDSIVLRGYLDNISSWLSDISARMEYLSDAFRYITGFGLAGILIVLLYFIYRFFNIFF